mmetsp:Transcript_2532/g.6736  ORF Transcript_2532/g.6736 Transcript_2532/m.6736 type:complete len:302 (-) Transcript_2532:54-959(-)
MRAPRGTTCRLDVAFPPAPCPVQHFLRRTDSLCPLRMMVSVVRFNLTHTSALLLTPNGPNPIPLFLPLALGLLPVVFRAQRRRLALDAAARPRVLSELSHHDRVASNRFHRALLLDFDGHQRVIPHLRLHIKQRRVFRNFLDGRRPDVERLIQILLPRNQLRSVPGPQQELLLLLLRHRGHGHPVGPALRAAGLRRALDLVHPVDAVDAVALGVEDGAVGDVAGFDLEVAEGLALALLDELLLELGDALVFVGGLLLGFPDLFVVFDGRGVPRLLVQELQGGHGEAGSVRERSAVGVGSVG